MTPSLRAPVVAETDNESRLQEIRQQIVNLVAWRAEQLRGQCIVEHSRALRLDDVASGTIPVTITGEDEVQRKVTVRPPGALF